MIDIEVMKEFVSEKIGNKDIEIISFNYNDGICIYSPIDKTGQFTSPRRFKFTHNELKVQLRNQKIDELLK